MNTNTLMLGEMVLTIETITKKIADEMLSRNSTNRTLRTRYVNQYARDMMGRKWRPKPLAICFLPDGSLGNGQHTLRAISLTGIPQVFLVARNVPKSTIAIMDRGAVRSIEDVSVFVGEKMTRTEASIAKVLMLGVAAKSTLSFDEISVGYRYYQEAIDFVVKGARREKGISTAVLSVCARASFTHSHAEISSFLDVIHTGISSPEQSAAIRLRDILKSAVGIPDRVDIYQRTQSALYAFLQKRPISKVLRTENEYFPIPKLPSFVLDTPETT